MFHCKAIPYLPNHLLIVGHLGCFQFFFFFFANTEILKMVFKRKQVSFLRQMKYTMKQTVMIC